MVKLAGFLTGFLAVGLVAFLALWGLPNQTQAANNTPGWSVNDAAVYVRYQVWERHSSCNVTECFTHDPILYAFNFDTKGEPLPARFKASLASLIATGGVYEASFWEDCPCWRVTARFNSEEPDGYTFIVWENTGIVESEAWQHRYVGE
jgi:hypothetical protein